MKIQAVKFYQNGFMTEPFAFGGEDGMEAFDAGKKYRSCLQNYVIDTGNEVILVDTGFLPISLKPCLMKTQQSIWASRLNLIWKLWRI